MILCCGEALIDMIPKPTEADRDGYVPYSGGAIFNTSIGLGRLGVQAGMLSGVSNDLFGQQLVAALAASHVDSTNLIRSDRPTTLAFVQLTDGHATYTFYDENSAGRMILATDLPALSDDVNALYFGGISLCAEPAASTYLALLEREAETRVIMLDPNIRPGFIDDIAGYRSRLDRMLALSDIVKVSDEDLNWIYPGPESLEDKLASLRTAGPSVVILTRGGDGASAFLASGEQVHAPVNKVEVVDTVGAGDTFNAGVLARLSELGVMTKDGLRAAPAGTIRSALEFGARVAAVTVSRAGANPPWRHELG
ncbi:MAG: carbohydrate kinase [Paracoccaceae bacterium]|jgi:fructokinase|nr:carbohydrate kinase [Paracoccaceae bacterium]